ncbi:MAG: hypothetical protein EHM33_02035 [Chloroflexi bacterium]|nr:MAG: hypothetical protein EHM33_02035 [Chloroflexota bacterium]
MIPDTVYIEGSKYQRVVVSSGRPPLWETMVGQQYTPPDPAVVILKDDPHAKFDEQLQYFVRAVNYNMTIQAVCNLFGSGAAFFNAGKGFPPRHNYLTGEDADGEDPQTDKVRTCLHNVLTGVQEGDSLNVLTFDSRAPIPLKPGCTYPRSVEEADISIYAITPQTHPWLFVVCNIMNTSWEVVPFPHGGLYPWTGDNKPYSFLPLVSNHGYGPVLRPLTTLRRLGESEPIPSPYRQT